MWTYYQISYLKLFKAVFSNVINGYTTVGHRVTGKWSAMEDWSETDHASGGLITPLGYAMPHTSSVFSVTWISIVTHQQVLEQFMNNFTVIRFSINIPGNMHLL